MKESPKSVGLTSNHVILNPRKHGLISLINMLYQTIHIRNNIIHLTPYRINNSFRLIRCIIILREVIILSRRRERRGVLFPKHIHHTKGKFLPIDSLITHQQIDSRESILKPLCRLEIIVHLDFRLWAHIQPVIARNRECQQ